MSISTITIEYEERGLEENLLLRLKVLLQSHRLVVFNEEPCPGSTTSNGYVLVGLKFAYGGKDGLNKGDSSNG